MASRTDDDYYRAFKMREDGRLFREIGEAFGVSIERARQMVGTGRRKMLKKGESNAIGKKDEPAR